MASDGINRLIAVTQRKAANANDDAMSVAEKQKSHLEKKQSLRDVQSAFDEATKDSVSQTGPKTKAGAVATEAAVAKPADYFGRFVQSGFGASSKFSASELMKNLDSVGSNPSRFASAINAFIEAFKKSLEESSKDLGSQDKLGNFEIQSLMSAYNEASTLASSTKKKMDDQNASVISKI